VGAADPESGALVSVVRRLLGGGFVTFELSVVPFDQGTVPLVRHAAPLQGRTFGVALLVPKIRGLLEATGCDVVSVGGTIVTF
jgi:hypothetical protein